MIVVDLKEMTFDLESKSLEIVNLIKNEDTSTHDLDVIIEDIRHILACYSMIKINHVLCEAN